jgi:transposase-like protein
MSDTRTAYTSEYKAKMAILAVKETMTISEISSKYEIDPSQVCRWKKDLIEKSKDLFEDKRKKEKNDDKEKEKIIEQLYKQV